MLDRPRSSRIYYNGNVLRLSAQGRRGAVEARPLRDRRAACCPTVKAELFPIKNPKNFEDWVTNQFG